MNLNLLKLSTVAQLGVKSRDTALPGSPSNGDIYIVPSGGNADKVAVRDNGAWVYFTPVAGWRAWVIDESLQVVFNGTAWVTAPEPIDIPGYFSGVPTSEERVLRYVFTRAVTFPDNFAGSQAKARVAATSTTVFDVSKNTTVVGSITFAAAGTNGVYATSGTGTESFVAGDVLSVTAPSGPDGTLADIALTLVGSR